MVKPGVSFASFVAVADGGVNVDGVSSAGAGAGAVFFVSVLIWPGAAGGPGGNCPGTSWACAQPSERIRLEIAIRCRDKDVITIQMSICAY
jgi:hypothetical protein